MLTESQGARSMSAICYGRRQLIRPALAGAVFAVVATPAAVAAGEKPAATLYKNPQCGCCEEYAAYLRQHGYRVTVKPTHDLALLSRQHGVPEPLQGCHTTLIDGYVVEGHVPVKAIDRLLVERPAIKGISLPGKIGRAHV